MNYTQVGATPLTDPRDVLTRTGFFSPLSAGQLDQVATLCMQRAFSKGTTIYRIGESPDEFFVLVDGVVRFSLCLGHANTSAGEIISRGDVFGWASLIEGARVRLATAHCLTPCRVFSLRGADLLGLMEQDKELGYALMKNLNALISGNLSHFVAG